MEEGAFCFGGRRIPSYKPPYTLSGAHQHLLIMGVFFPLLCSVSTSLGEDPAPFPGVFQNDPKYSRDGAL